MERIAEFEKVSFEQYMEALRKADPQRSEQEVRRIYDAIRLFRVKFIKKFIIKSRKNYIC